MNKMYLLEGIIFQGMTGLMPAHLLLIDFMQYGVFHGVVGSSSPDSDEKPSGSAHDIWGDSILTNFVKTETTLTFDKTYKGRPTITYEYEKHVDIWLGVWKGPDCGTGKTKLFVREIEKDFFKPY